MLNRTIETVGLRDWRHSDARPATFLVQVYVVGRRSPLYLRSVRRGEYDWTTDPLYARCLSLKTAARHAASLLEKGVI